MIRQALGMAGGNRSKAARLLHLTRDTLLYRIQKHNIKFDQQGFTLPIAYIHHPDCLLHDVGSGHPERPARLNAIWDQLISSGMEIILQQHEAPLVKQEHLDRVHDPDYVWDCWWSALRGCLKARRRHLHDAQDTGCRVACRGGSRTWCRPGDGRQGEFRFCAVRPPGHHAERHRAMGFCYFNNVAVGAAYALDICGLDRVAIIDFDVHHGNGTEDIFQHDPRVLFCSSFSTPFYPLQGTIPQ